MKCQEGMAWPWRVAVVVAVLLRGATAVCQERKLDCMPDNMEIPVREGSELTLCVDFSRQECHRMSTTLYVLPGGDLKGVTLEVHIGTNDPKSYAAWFDLDTCDDDGNTWRALNVSVYKSSSDGTTTEFIINNNNKYRAVCTRSTVPGLITGLKIDAHGSSKWTEDSRTSDGYCPGLNQISGQCTEPSGTTGSPSPPSSSTTVTTVIIVIIIIVVMVVVAVVVVRRRKQRGRAP